MDFGDALNLAMSAKESGFKSLDEAFAKDRQGAGRVPVIGVPSSWLTVPVKY